MKSGSKHESKIFFEKIVDEHAPRLYAHIIQIVQNHEDADDILQEVFIKVWKNLEKFRGEAQLYTWLFKIAHNETLGYLRRKKISRWVPFHPDHARTKAAEEKPDYEKAEKEFFKALEKLPPRQRLVFHYRHFDQMSYAEISRITGLSEGALRASYHHAVKKLEQALKAVF